MKFQLVSAKPRILASTASPSTGRKFSFLVLSELLVKATCPSITVTSVLPKRILLLALTRLPAPMAVAFTRLPADTSALDPLAVLLLPVVLFASAAFPLAVLALPVVLPESAKVPLAVLLAPVVLPESAKCPLAVLLKPVVLPESAACPLAVLALPVVLFWSAPDPPAVFPKASLSSLFGGAPQLSVPPNMRMRPAIPNAFPQTFFMGASSYAVIAAHPKDAVADDADVNKARDVADGGAPRAVVLPR